MSRIEVDKIDPQSGTALEIGSSGDTATIPSGATLTIASGATLTNSGTATGFAGIAWQSITTAATLTTVAGKGYPINTTSNACTVTLPGSASVGDQVQIVDYAGTFGTNAITLTSSLKINGGTDDKRLTTNREGVTITYVDVTQGWVATSGVNSGDQALDPDIYSVDFLVVAGGGGGARHPGPGGGGAGGYRNSYSSEASGGGGSSETALEFALSTVYTITVGAGGAAQASAQTPGNVGIDSSISGTGITTITSAGGGYGGAVNGSTAGVGGNGGSGGGGGITAASGTTGTSSGTLYQGFGGGSASSDGATYDSGGGGGGASAVGTNGTDINTPGVGGNGLASSITAAAVTRTGGGGGSTGATAQGAGGSGGGGAGGSGTGVAGTVNTGSGGGGGTSGGGAGGKGVVILRMATASYSSTTTGSPTVSTDGSDTILVFNDSGSYTG